MTCCVVSPDSHVIMWVYPLSLQLSECESAVQNIERELRSHGKQWEALHESAAKDAAAITQLEAYRGELEEELKEKSRTVKHLEGLLQEVGLLAA